MHSPDFFHRANADYLERLHAQYGRDPSSLDESWRAFFAGLKVGDTAGSFSSAAASRSDPLSQSAYDLVHSYRELGHCSAQLDPLGRQRRSHPLLELKEFGLSDADLDRPVDAASFLGPNAATLRELLGQLRATYCGTIGVEYMEITDKEQRKWLQEHMEPVLNRPMVSDAQSRRVLELLITAETFEKYLHAKFVGQKRFSIEGAEALLPLLDALIEEGAALGIEEVVMGMAHRGRLNVLAHVVHKPYEIILSEFEDTTTPQMPVGEGDVKHHLGYSCNRVTEAAHKIHCSLSSNPSHLELVNPVIEGMVRAKQEHRGDDERCRVAPILIHGEAAFTGQGIVPETLNLSELRAYRTGGTIHVIINNQIGFTATAEQTRFTPYPTDIAKAIQAPIIHVNGDDPEAVVHVAKLAIAFRQRFKTDVLIDLWCYRRHGHNETDDPTFTQPLMYKVIDEHPPVAKIYAERLAAAGKIDGNAAEQMRATVRQKLEQAHALARELKPRQRIFTLAGLWQGLGRAGNDWSAQTAVTSERLNQVTAAAAKLPEGFSLHHKLKRLFQSRASMAAGKQPVDWGCAEMWSLGSLLLEGTAVRITGQDVERGTFSQRHAVLHDVERGTRYVPLEHLARDQGRFTIVNTMLSELGVLGFEYGFSSADPWTLVVWEAQFGDFANGAQPIMDQFIAAAESKWQRMSGIVLLLPHGYEGQGPEHSSARLERFLQLAAENNLQICNPTHPAQYFHLLRRQMHRNFRKPLVVMTPKSLLRYEPSFSPLADFTSGGFRLVIDDPAAPRPEQVRRLVFVSGRLFYRLLVARDESATGEIALVRVEQLYPFPRDEIKEVISKYRRAEEVFWAQEEPRNMGAWSFIEPRLGELLPDGMPFTYQGRDEAASPATGSFNIHQAEEAALIQRTIGLAAPVKPAVTEKPLPQPASRAAPANGDGSPTKQTGQGAVHAN